MLFHAKLDVYSFFDVSNASLANTALIWFKYMDKHSSLLWKSLPLQILDYAELGVT